MLLRWRVLTILLKLLILILTRDPKLYALKISVAFLVFNYALAELLKFLVWSKLVAAERALDFRLRDCTS